MEAAATRRPCFVEADHGLASLATEEDMEAGFSGHSHHHLLLSRPLFHTTVLSRKPSLRNLSLPSPPPPPPPSSSYAPPAYAYAYAYSPRSGRFFDSSRFEDPQPHFLQACSLCKKPLGDNKDIFMYRGDTPFCSEECRQEQIDVDEAKEKNWNLSASRKALRKESQRKSNSPNKAQGYPFRTGAVAAA